jgi:hypothetical protein
MTLKYNLKQLSTSPYIYFNPTKMENLEDIQYILKADPTFIFPNEGDTTDTYENVTEYIYRLIEKTGFLSQRLNEIYIKETFRTSDAILILSSKGMNVLPNGNIFAFSVLQFNEVTNSIFIDILCSHIGIKYAGDILMKAITTMAKRLFITTLQLTSISSAVAFYEKYGFYKKGICEEDTTLYKMEKTV